MCGGYDRVRLARDRAWAGPEASALHEAVVGALWVRRSAPSSLIDRKVYSRAVDIGIHQQSGAPGDPTRALLPYAGH